MSDIRLPLTNVRVLSFGAFVAGNIAARLLAELGADVVKIEARNRPEVLRTPAHAIGPTVVEPSGVQNTAMYASLTRGTRSLSIDLACSEARPVFHDLVAVTDIVIENFGGSVLDRWGCAYATLLADNPALVMLSLSGYGRTGPRADYRAYASTICAYIGLSAVWGYTHGNLTDYLTGASGALAAVAALGDARGRGTSAYIDIAQIDVMAPVLAGLYVGPLNDVYDVPRASNRVPGSWLSGLFASKGDDAWLAVDLEDKDDWNAMCSFLNRADLMVVDAASAERLEPELRRALSSWACNHVAHTGMHVLQKRGLAAAVVQHSDEIWRDPQLNVRTFKELIDQADLGPVTYAASAQRWGKTPALRLGASPRLGQHTYEILEDWLGLSGERLEALSSEGAIFDAGQVSKGPGEL